MEKHPIWQMVENITGLNQEEAEREAIKKLYEFREAGKEFLGNLKEEVKYSLNQILNGSDKE